MPKIILEKIDVEKLINKEYGNSEIVSGLKDDTEIIIRVKELKANPVNKKVELKKEALERVEKLDRNVMGSGVGGERNRNIARTF